jgi:hypothetical protein
MERFIEELERSFLERPHFLRTVLKVNGYDPDDDEDAIEDAIKNAFATTADVLMLTVGGEGPELTAIVDFDEDNWSERFNRPFHDIQNEIVDQSGGNIHVVDFKIFRTLNGGKYTLEVREKNCEFEIEDNVHNRSFSILNYDNGRYIHILINRSVRARRLTTDARPINAIMEILAKFDSYEQITEIMWNDFSRLIGVSDAFFVLRDAAERKWAIDGKLPTFTDLAWAPGKGSCLGMHRSRLLVMKLADKRLTCLPLMNLLREITLSTENRAMTVLKNAPLIELYKVVAQTQ